LSGGISGLSGGATGLTGGATGLTGGGMTGFNGTTQGNGSFRGGFWGSMPNGATGFTGSTYGNTGSSNNALGATNAFGKYYSNPLAPGAPNASNSTNFYTPIYGNATGSQGNYTSNFPQGNTNMNPYGNNTGGRRTAAYVVGLGFGSPPPGARATQAEVEQILARSTGLSANRGIRVAVDGPAVVLRGTVATEYDRRLAEALIRLSPGVYAVRNELEVADRPPPLPGPGP
jgi:hypothetical protein